MSRHSADRLERAIEKRTRREGKAACADECCVDCGATYEYTPGCEGCDESRAALHAMTGDPRYKFPRHFRRFEASNE